MRSPVISAWNAKFSMCSQVRRPEIRELTELNLRVHCNVTPYNCRTNQQHPQFLGDSTSGVFRQWLAKIAEFVAAEAVG